MNTIVVFTRTDRYGLWRKGDTAIDLGWESTPEVGHRLLEIVRTGEVISLYQPYEAGVIEEKGSVNGEVRSHT